MPGAPLGPYEVNIQTLKRNSSPLLKYLWKWDAYRIIWTRLPCFPTSLQSKRYLHLLTCLWSLWHYEGFGRLGMLRVYSGTENEHWFLPGQGPDASNPPRRLNGSKCWSDFRFAIPLSAVGFSQSHALVIHHRPSGSIDEFFMKVWNIFPRLQNITGKLSHGI